MQSGSLDERSRPLPVDILYPLLRILLPSQKANENTGPRGIEPSQLSGGVSFVGVLNTRFCCPLNKPLFTEKTT